MQLLTVKKQLALDKTEQVILLNIMIMTENNHI